MRRSLSVLLFLAGAVMTSCSQERDVPQSREPSIAWSGTLDEAKMEAQKTGDRILASFEAYWCTWSRLLRESLYVNPAVIESLGAYKCVAIDGDKDSSLCREYDVRVYPTIIVMDPYGGEIERIIGYCPPHDFLKRLSLVRQTDEMLADMFRRETTSENDPEFLMDFGDLLRNMGTYDAALMRYEKAAAMDKGNRLGICEEATYAMAECCMLAGEYKEAGRRFGLFTESYPTSETGEEALLLGALCYEQRGDRKDALDLLGKYLMTYRTGSFVDFVRNKREALKARRDGGR